MTVFTTSSSHYTKRLNRLRWLATGLALFLLLPAVGLGYLGYAKLEREQLEDLRGEAFKLTLTTNRKLYKRYTMTNSLPVDAFDYYQQVYNPLTKRIEQVLSPLAALESDPYYPGLVGYFQYDQEGSFNSPVWPYAIDPSPSDVPQNLSSELAQRYAEARKLRDLLSRSATINGKLAQGLEPKAVPINLAFDIPGHIVFYRQAMIEQVPRLQGYLVNRQEYLQTLLMEMLEFRSLSVPIQFALQDKGDQGNTLYFFSESIDKGKLPATLLSQPVPHLAMQSLYSGRLNYPYSDFTLSISTHAQPTSAAMIYSSIAFAVLLILIVIACYGFYRFGVNQLALAEQRLNFVSAVSHELKTPLTSIRMYAEMLKSGTVLSKAACQDYYGFIFNESERLTRLINNVLQLANLTHQPGVSEPQYVALGTLQHIVRTKTASLLENRGFRQHITDETPVDNDILVLADEDAFAQVLINITDNALKFFDEDKIPDPDRKTVDFVFRLNGDDPAQLELVIRDYGQGIGSGQETLIFDLFYRGGSELTRTTQGTGIGLALVRELMSAQQGEVSVTRMQPGLAIHLVFQCKTSGLPARRTLPAKA